VWEETHRGIEKIRPSIWKHLPQLSIEERDRRWREIRRRMAGKGLGCLLIFGDEFVQYVTHVPTNTICAIFPLSEEPVVYYGMRAFDWYWQYGVGQNWTRDCRSMTYEHQMRDLVQTMKNLGLERGKIGVAIPMLRRPMWTRSLNIQRRSQILENLQVKEALPEASFVDATDILDEMMMIKSAEEIGFLEKAAELAYLMFEAMKETAATPGSKECDLYANMIKASISNGGDLDMIMLDSGSSPMMHAKGTGQFCCTTRRLERGDIIITEYHATYGGYKIAKEHSLSLGEPLKQYKDIFEVCKECHRKGVEAMTPGTPVSEVAKAFRTPADEAGMAYVELGFCGHGLESASFPTVIATTPYLEESSLMPRAPRVELKLGMVFGTNVDIYNPKWRESVLMLGDTILVTENGPRKLTNIPLEFTIV